MINAENSVRLEWGVGVVLRILSIYSDVNNGKKSEHPVREQSTDVECIQKVNRWIENMKNG